jgi:heme A synthase
VRVHRFAIAAAVATFILTIFGGVVSVTESGLACPDWPLCEGKFIPQMVDGKQYEHSHRLVASFVGAMTFGLMALLIKYRRKQPYLVKLGIFASVLVTFQALLGAATVILRLPWEITSAHLAVATLFFVLMTTIAFLTHPSRTELPDVQKSLTRVIVPVAILLFVQVVGGGVMRHLRAGLACGFDLPFCHGVLWPLDGYVGVQVHMVHRLLGVLSALALLGMMVWIWRRPEASRALKIVAGVAGFGVVAQVTLGVMTVLLSREIFTINTHSSLGIGLMSVVTWMYWLSTPAAAVVPARVVQAPAPRPSAANPVEA